MNKNVKVLSVDKQVFLGEMKEDKRSGIRTIHDAVAISGNSAAKQVKGDDFAKLLVDEKRERLLTIELDKNAAVMSRELDEEETIMYTNLSQKMDLAEKYAVTDIICQKFADLSGK